MLKNGLVEAMSNIIENIFILKHFSKKKIFFFPNVMCRLINITY